MHMVNNNNKKVLKLFFLNFIILFSCNNQHTNTLNNITVLVKVIDSETKQPRTGDRVDVRKIKKPLFSMWQFVKIGEYITDDKGQVKIVINNKKGYRISSFGLNHAFGSVEFTEGELKNNQEIIIEVVSPDKKNIPWIK